MYLLLPQDEQALGFDGMIGGQILPTAPLDSILESLPNTIACGPGDADMMPLPVIDEERQLCDLKGTKPTRCSKLKQRACLTAPRLCFRTYLVIDQYLHRVVAPLYEDQLVGLAWNSVGKRCAHTGGRIRLEPHAHGEGVHLRQALLHFGVHVVGSQWERQLEFIQRPVFSLACVGDIETGWLQTLWKHQSSCVSFLSAMLNTCWGFR